MVLGLVNNQGSLLAGEEEGSKKDGGFLAKGKAVEPDHLGCLPDRRQGYFREVVTLEALQLHYLNFIPYLATEPVDLIVVFKKSHAVGVGETQEDFAVAIPKRCCEIHRVDDLAERDQA